jgi:PhnB protein
MAGRKHARKPSTERHTIMTVTTTAHANFRGQAREALTFYHSVFGGDLSLATYADIHSVESPGQADHIAFGRVKAPNGFDIMAYDVQPSKGYNPGENAFYITLQGNDADEIKAQWDGLADGAAIILIPLAPAPFAPLYGMLTDRYGVTWIVGVDTPRTADTLTLFRPRRVHPPRPSWAHSSARQERHNSQHFDSQEDRSSPPVRPPNRSPLVRPSRDLDRPADGRRQRHRVERPQRPSSPFLPLNGIEVFSRTEIQTHRTVSRAARCDKITVAMALRRDVRMVGLRPLRCRARQASRQLLSRPHVGDMATARPQVAAPYHIRYTTSAPREGL